MISRFYNCVIKTVKTVSNDNRQIIFTRCRSETETSGLTLKGVLYVKDRSFAVWLLLTSH